MLGNEFSSYPQGPSAGDTLHCNIESLLHNEGVGPEGKLGGLLAEFSLTANRGVPGRQG